MGIHIKNKMSDIVKLQAMVTAMQEKFQWVQAWQEEIQIRLEALESANMPTDEELLARKRYNERLKHSGEHEGQAEEED